MTFASRSLSAAASELTKSESMTPCTKSFCEIFPPRSLNRHCVMRFSQLSRESSERPNSSARAPCNAASGGGTRMVTLPSERGTL